MGRATHHNKSISTLGQKGRLSKCALNGSKNTLIFFRVAFPHRYLHIGSSTMNVLEKLSRILPDSRKWHDSLDRKWMRPGMLAQQEQRSPARIVKARSHYA